MTTKRQLTYHPLCRDLAELFLESEFIQNADERLEAIDDLAQDIQQAIEDWLSERQVRRPARQVEDRTRPAHDLGAEASQIVNERKARLVENLRSYPRDLLQLFSDAADEIERLRGNAALARAILKGS